MYDKTKFIYITVRVEIPFREEKMIDFENTINRISEVAPHLYHVMTYSGANGYSIYRGLCPLSEKSAIVRLKHKSLDSGIFMFTTYDREEEKRIGGKERYNSIWLRIK